MGFSRGFESPHYQVSLKPLTTAQRLLHETRPGRCPPEVVDASLCPRHAKTKSCETKVLAGVFGEGLENLEKAKATRHQRDYGTRRPIMLTTSKAIVTWG